MITDAAILDAVPADGSAIGVRDLARAVGTSVPKLKGPLERLVAQGTIIVERPGTGALGERMVRRDGVTELNALRVKVARITAERDELRTALEQMVALGTHALGSHR